MHDGGDSASGRDGTLGTEYLPDRDRRHQRGSGRACLRPGAALSPGLFRGPGSPVQRPGSGGEFHPDESARGGSPNHYPDSGRSRGIGGWSGFSFHQGSLLLRVTGRPGPVSAGTRIHRRDRRDLFRRGSAARGVAFRRRLPGPDRRLRNRPRRGFRRGGRRAGTSRAARH